MTDSLVDKRAKQPGEHNAGSSTIVEQQQATGSSLLCHLIQFPSRTDGASKHAYDPCQDGEELVVMPGLGGLAGALRVAGTAALRTDMLSQAARKLVTQLGQLKGAGELTDALKAQINDVSSMSSAVARRLMKQLDDLAAANQSPPDLMWAIAKFKLAALKYLL